jgi:hypothetical protein
MRERTDSDSGSVKLAFGFAAALALSIVEASSVEAQQTCPQLPNVPVVPGQTNSASCNASINSGRDFQSVVDRNTQLPNGTQVNTHISTSSRETGYTNIAASSTTSSTLNPIVLQGVNVLNSPQFAPVAPSNYSQPSYIVPPSYQPDRGNAIVANDPNNPSAGIVYRCVTGSGTQNPQVPCPVSEYSPYYLGAAGLQNPNNQYSTPNTYNYAPGQYNPNMSYANPGYGQPVINPSVTQSARCDTIRRLGAEIARTLHIDTNSPC